tara:strand:+ start:244 stop:501 length:258 start_codon:yes stop_codon:yes gene_type:complete
MGFEKTMNILIKDVFEERNKDVPKLEWFNGTLYADTNDKVEAMMIKNIIQDYTGYQVDKNLLKATPTEPWDQYAYDITNKKLGGK